MDTSTSPRLKKLKSLQDVSLNVKNCVTCTNVPEGLFDAAVSKKHFSKFGRVHRIKLFPKRQMCMVEYDQMAAAERAVLNAGAFDGFMFDVTRTKPRVRRRSSKKEDDPDWLPDADVEEELSAMSGAPIYRLSRQKPMDMDAPKFAKVPKQLPLKKKMPAREIQPTFSQTSSVSEAKSSVAMTQTSLSTSEAAAELAQLRSRVALTPDEQWRALDARDRILRAWGGAGARVKVGGATIGTCRDMCPEKERLHRQAEHQVMTLETVVDSDGTLEAWRAVKQYSRSSADQEMPMCYELRPSPSLMMTCSYLLHEIADTTRQISMADWFHFLWDRFRGIRKDITQQALCCAESICLVEMCARFHAHCAARLADLEHTQFDPKLNTDNLTKCLQTLKHMYADVDRPHKPREAEFRGYIALLNLGDSNFWWEIKQLPQEIQKSEPIIFAIKIFNALDNNNYVRFFRLVKEKATYLQACILLRYFNDVRARALARIVKAFAPRGGSRYPAQELINSLAFQTPESMKSFINHYGLRCGKIEDTELTVILDRNHFIEDSDPYPLSRELVLIESKRQCSVGNVISGGSLPNKYYQNHNLHSSFNEDGTFKEGSLLAEELGYDTFNDTNKDVRALKSEVQRISQGERTNNDRITEVKSSLFVKQEPKSFTQKTTQAKPFNTQNSTKFSFNPAITVAPTDIIKKSPEKIFNSNTNVFSFSKPQESMASNLWSGKDTTNLFKPPTAKPVFGDKTATNSTNLFSKANSENKDPFKSSQVKGMNPSESNLFKKPDAGKPILNEVNSDKVTKSIFGMPQKPGSSLFTSVQPNKNLFLAKPENENKFSNVFGKTNADNNIFSKTDSSPRNIFATVLGSQDATKSSVASNTKSVFGTFKSTFADKPEQLQQNLFTTANEELRPKSIFATNGEVTSNNMSPGTFFKSVMKPQTVSNSESFSIFQNKNNTEQTSVAANIFNSVNSHKAEDVYNFDPQKEDSRKQIDEEKRKQEEALKEQEKIQEVRIQQQKLKEARKAQEELKRLEELKQREELEQLEEKKRLEEVKLEEERKQEELKRKFEEEKKVAEIKRKTLEEKLFKEKVDKESAEIIEEVLTEINTETVAYHLKEEIKSFNNLMSYGQIIAIEILNELCDEIVEAETKAEMIWSEKIMKKYFGIWKEYLLRNVRRRNLLDGTPIWITDNSPEEKAKLLKRFVESSALKNMNAIHKGYRFIGELNLPPAPEPLNIMEIIKSSLLKRMKQIQYPYNKCFFWKLTLISPGIATWLNRKIEIEKWLLDVFSDKQHHETSESLIHVGRQSWNHLMDFAISVSLANRENQLNYDEALEGSNALLFYASNDANSLNEIIAKTVKEKYPYHIVPVAIITPEIEDSTMNSKLGSYLTDLVNSHTITNYKIFVLDSKNISESLNTTTKNALKWLARNYPPIPSLEIDYLKSMCQRYLGNEIWWKLKLERGTIMRYILKDLIKLVKIYNIAVDKLTNMLTNEDLFNYPSFPLEFKQFLSTNSPYPKPNEFIPSNVKTSENVFAIRDIMKQLRLPEPKMNLHPLSYVGTQEDIRIYSKQIGWFQNPEEVVCKIVSTLPNNSDIMACPSENTTCQQFTEIVENYDFMDILNILVYEKINNLKNLDNRYAIYEKSALEDFRNCHWFYELESDENLKALEYDDELDYIIEAKRRKMEQPHLDYLTLEDKDYTLVEENIKATNNSISNYNNYEVAVKQLEKQLEEERKKSQELENLLKSALSNN